MNPDYRPKLLIPLRLILAKEKILVLILIIAFFLCTISILPTPLSRAFVKLGNAQFSSGNDRVGTASYSLARLFNTKLNESVDQCYAFDAKELFESAVDYCTKIIEIDNNYAAAYSYRGYAYLRLNQYNLAVADFTKDIELIPTATRSYINRGIAYMDQNKYDLAITDFTRSISINPNESKAYLNRGLAYLKKGQSKLTINDCDKASELKDKFWNAYLCLGLAFRAQKKYDLALANFNEAIQINPNVVTSYIERGNAFAENEEYGQAIMDYQVALTKTSDANAISYIYCIQGVTYTKMDNFNSAIISLEKGVEMDTTNQNSWCKAALENARQGVPTR